MNTGTSFFLLILAFAGTAHSQGTPSEYTTYVGSANACHIARIRSDAAGNTWVAGNNSSGSLSEIFVASLGRDGKMATYLSFGGNGIDTVSDMALDPAGNIVLAGATTSTSFPLYQAMQSAPGPGFVVKLDARTNQILFATYFPAAVSGVAVDASGNVYLTGSTTSSSFPVTAGLPAGGAGGQLGENTAAFLTKISAAGDRILYSTRISGTVKNCGCCSSCFLSARHAAGVAVAIDAAGNAYLAGNTDTADLPVTPGALLANGTGAFVARINAAGTALSYLTYIGPSYDPSGPNTGAANAAAAIAVDSSGSVYLAGSTFDPVFPATAGAYQTAYAGPAPNLSDPFPLPPTDAFALKLKPDGSGLNWATYLGGSGADGANSIALDASGNVWIAGTTASPDFPNAQGWSQGGDFLAELNAAGSALPYAARYPADSVSQSLTLDGSGILRAAGSAGIVSAIVPAAPPVTRIFGIANAAFGTVSGRLVGSELISIFGPHIGPPSPVTYTPTSTGFVPTTLGGVQVKMGGFALPLLYVSDSQINAIAPSSLFGTAAGFTLQAIANGVAAPPFPVAPISADPEIFQNADGTAAAVNQDGSINSPDHPAKGGSVVSIWLTGAGTISTILLDGQIATSALAFGCCMVYMGFNSAAANIVYSGSAPGAAVGVVQINFQLPSNMHYSGATQIWVTAGGQISHPALLYASQ